MAIKELPYVKVESVGDSFNAHLEDDINERILFSAPFGAGKSTFLKDFFEKHQEYITLKLYPVNYSISGNQDVFELIKYDLLYELLSRYPEDIQLDNEQFSTLLVSQMFLLHRMKLDVPLKLLLKAASLVSGGEAAALDKSVDMITEVFKNFTDYKKEVNTNDVSKLNNYIQSIKKRTGHAYESDEITELIITMLSNVKELKCERNEKCKTVLLIDDLDRLDPEHVFRLFNIFSAHYDETTETNKFGFDKIIFVCDVNNIQQMFNHKYGLNVEFSGYIDKYYSSEIFKFDIAKFLKECLRNLILSKYEPLKYFTEPNSIANFLVDRFDLNKTDGFYHIFSFVLNAMIDQDLIRIRNFKRFKFFCLPNETIKHKQGNSYWVFHPFLVLTSNIERFFPRPIDLEKALQKLYSEFPSNYKPQGSVRGGEYFDEEFEIIRYSLSFIIDPKQLFSFSVDKNLEYNMPFTNETGQEIFVSYTLGQDPRHDYVFVNYNKCTLALTGDSDKKNNQPAIIRPNPYWFFYVAYRTCISKKYL